MCDNVPLRWVIVINIAVVFALGFCPENDGGAMMTIAREMK